MLLNCQKSHRSRIRAVLQPTQAAAIVSSYPALFEPVHFFQFRRSQKARNRLFCLDVISWRLCLDVLEKLGIVAACLIIIYQCICFAVEGAHISLFKTHPLYKSV